MRQPDLFNTDDQPELFDSDRAPALFHADPDKVRLDLHAMLARLRAAEKLPWSREDARYHQTVFPQMSRWLPEDEAAQLCFEFEKQMTRLLAA